MSQHAYPTSDSQVGSWTTAPLYSQIDETSPDDTDYISFNGLTGSTAAIFGITDLSAPNLTRGRVFLRARARHTGKDGARLTLVLKDSSATTVATLTTQLGQDFVTFTHDLDATELALSAAWTSMTLTLSYSGTGVCDVSSLTLDDEGTEDKCGFDGQSDGDMKNGGYCSITGYWYPASQLMTVNGKRVWIGTGRTPRVDETDGGGR